MLSTLEMALQFLYLTARPVRLATFLRTPGRPPVLLAIWDLLNLGVGGEPSQSETGSSLIGVVGKLIFSKNSTTILLTKEPEWNVILCCSYLYSSQIHKCARINARRLTHTKTFTFLTKFSPPHSMSHLS